MKSRRLKLVVAYDGRPYSGWQSQANHNGVQDHLEHAFERILAEKIRVHGAGRTDAGVHAIGQSAHVDVSSEKLGPPRLMAALNAVLPPTIRILRCRPTTPGFHARFSAKGKVYRYQIYRGVVLPPLDFGRAWQVPMSLNIDLARTACRLFVGTHDFAGFAANRGKSEADTNRTLYAVRIQSAGPRLTIEFDGNGFLYRMVRLLVGAIVQCGLGKISHQEIVDRLGRKGNSRMRLAAPAHGLFLVRVRY